jgi:hypothetical protein
VTNLIGRKVRLTGPAWQGNEWTPARGTVHTIVDPKVPNPEPGAVYIEHGDWVCYVFLDAEGSLEGFAYDWSGELLGTQEADPLGDTDLRLHPSAYGYLDGFLSLPQQSMSEDYLAGYERGVTSAAQGGE